MKKVLLLLVVVFASMSLSAQEAGDNTSFHTTKPDTRYFLSTNLVSIAAFVSNMGLEMRFSGTFALKTSIFGGGPWPLNIPYDEGDRKRVLGLHIEPRWYMNERESFYMGVSLSPMLLANFARKYNSDEGVHYGGRKMDEWHVPISINFLVGWYVPVTGRFGIDFNLGIGLLRAPEAMPILPGGQATVALSWEL